MTQKARTGIDASAPILGVETATVRAATAQPGMQAGLPLKGLEDPIVREAAVQAEALKLGPDWFDGYRQGVGHTLTLLETSSMAARIFVRALKAAGWQPPTEENPHA